MALILALIGAIFWRNSFHFAKLDKPYLFDGRIFGWRSAFTKYQISEAFDLTGCRQKGLRIEFSFSGDY